MAYLQYTVTPTDLWFRLDYCGMPIYKIQCCTHLQTMILGANSVNSNKATLCNCVKMAACIYLFNFSHDSIFFLTYLTCVIFECCHQAVALPQNLVATNGTLLLSGTSLKFKTSSTALIQSQKFFRFQVILKFRNINL